MEKQVVIKNFKEQGKNIKIIKLNLHNQINELKNIIND